MAYDDAGRWHGERDPATGRFLPIGREGKPVVDRATTDPVARHALRITPRSACPWRGDPAGSDPYRSRAIASVEQFGGRFLDNDAEAETLDGQPEGKRVTIIGFANAQTAQRWYHSDEFQQALQTRPINFSVRGITMDLNGTGS
jgi:uncharacterized protein (DUF1330 family)